MESQILHLPDGQTFDVSPVFGGVSFRSEAYNTQNHPFPAGWTVVLSTEEESVTAREGTLSNEVNSVHELSTVDYDATTDRRSLDSDSDQSRTRPFTLPTLDRDSLFISSFANPPSTDFKPASSPTRYIAMMLWVTLYWYFHQPDPRAMPHSRDDWKVYIRHDGILRGRNLIPKLERMGLIASADSAVGPSHDDASDSWAHMFVSRRMFWQIPGRLFLFILEPKRGQVPGSMPSSSNTTLSSGPASSNRPQFPGDNSPVMSPPTSQPSLDSNRQGSRHPCTPVLVPPAFPVTAYYSTSYLPTYYPPAPLQYVFTGGVRHPLRPKPPRMGEIFYTRYVPSVGQYLSFRVASSSPAPVPYLGPICIGGNEKKPEQERLTTLSDTALLRTWQSKPNVCRMWGNYKPGQLETALQSKHLFPAIGMWNGVPFGYFEVCWVKEDVKWQQGPGSYGKLNDWDRGLHIMIGQEWAECDVAQWLTGLMHWCWMAESRTMNLCLEPPMDNQTITKHLCDLGFSRERHFSFSHKQRWFLRSRRETWEGPAL